MIDYYINPTTRDLIMVDTENNEIIIVSKIESVRVFIGSEVRLGDFKGENLSDEIDSKKVKTSKKGTGRRIDDITRQQIKDAIKAGDLRPGEIQKKFGISSAGYYQLKKE